MKQKVYTAGETIIIPDMVADINGKVIAVHEDLVLLEIDQKEWADITLNDTRSYPAKHWKSMGFDLKGAKPEKGKLFSAFHVSELE